MITIIKIIMINIIINVMAIATITIGQHASARNIKLNMDHVNIDNQI